MINTARISKLRAGAIALAAGLALSTATIAQAHGGAGHGGGAYGAGGGHAGGYGGGGHGGRGGYGARRGGYGYGRFGYGGFGYYGGFGLEYGLFFDALPLYYSTYWWGGSPYYYANDNFYQWNGSVGQYETVRPPQNLASQVATTPLENVVLFAYPRNGQTSAQQATDRIECQRWATEQSGIESSPAGSSVPAAASSVRRQDYLRAESACLEGRGYSVR
jgi:hypothetical protein